MDKKETKRFQEVQKRLSLLLTEELKLAENYSNKQQFNSSVIIYQNILNYMSEMLDQNNLKYIQDQLSESIFRLTLGGHVEWIELEKVLKQIQKRTPYQDYLIRMSQANTANKNANWKPKKNTFIKSDTLPYVLRFFTPQKYHTPTLAHFGHTVLDGLFPFTLAYANNTFERAIKHNASIYVLDIGLYLLPLLQTIFPQLNFIPFYQHKQLPEYYEVIELIGIGFVENENEVDRNPYDTIAYKQNITVIRDVIFKQLQVQPHPQCIVLISRTLQSQNLKSFHSKHLLDESHEAPGLNYYHNVGPGVHTAFYYYATTAHERRIITNEQKLFKDLVKVFNGKYNQCVQLIQLDKLSLKEQIQVYMNAKVVIGQHGAALTLSGFMPNDPSNRGILIELDPQYNLNFKLECDAMGVEYHHLHRDKYPGIYKTPDWVNIEVSSKVLVKTLKNLLKNWKGYQKKSSQESKDQKLARTPYLESMYEQGVYNGTSASPSPDSIVEREDFSKRSTIVDNDEDEDEDDDDDEDNEDEDEDDEDEDDEL